MPAAGAFRVERMDCAAIERSDRVLDKARFIQRVGVNGHLYVKIVSDGERRADHRGCRSPIFMAFETDRTGFDLLDEGCRSMCMTFAEKPDVDGQAFGGTQHHLDVPRTGRNGCGVCAI